MKTILFFHQSAELYGSDKSILNLLRFLRNHYNIILLLPEDGPLINECEKIKIEYHILDLFKISRASINLKFPFIFNKKINKSIVNINRIVNKRKIDLVYTNTLAIIIGAYWSHKKNIQHIWHIREIIENPFFIKNIYRYLLKSYANKIICNSNATQEWIANNKDLRSKSSVVWNGVNPIKTKSCKDKNKITISLIGRINKWKGQTLLIHAIKRLIKNNILNIKVLIVGSVHSSQAHLLDKLKTEISNLDLGEFVEIIKFTSSIDSIYNRTDIIVVPSIRPEPFGLVAIEGMSANIPIIGSNDGGLKEIIRHKETGFLFKSGSEKDLVKYLTILIKNKELRNKLGQNGKNRYNKFFNVNTYVNNIKNIIEK